MSNRLLLALDEYWPARPSCAWVLLGPDDRLLAEGHSGPDGWPAAGSCEVLLCGAQVLWLECGLPALGRRRRRELPSLLAYALEDRLLSDPETQHLTLTHRLPGEGGERDLAGVLVISKDRLRVLLAELKTLARQPRRVLAEVQTAPAGVGDWHLSLAAHGATLRIGLHNGMAIDVEDLAPSLARQLAHAGPAKPARILLHVEPGLALPDCAALADEICTPLAVDTPYLWWQAATPSADNLLHGEFGGGEAREVKRTGWRAPALLAAAALLLGGLASLGEALWLRHQEDDLGGRMRRIYQATFPDSPVVAPSAQMRQQLALERSHHGLLRHDDALALLAQVAGILGADAGDGVVAMRYEDGVLDLTLTSTLQARADELIVAFGAQGLLASLRDDTDPPHLLVRPEVLQ